LGDGLSVRLALLEAKRARIRAGAPPAAWATVVALGADDVAPRKAARPPPWAFIGVGVGLSVLGGLILIVALRGRRRPSGP